MEVYIVLYKTNYGGGTNTQVDKVFSSQSDAEDFVDSQSKYTSRWGRYIIEEKEVE